MATYPNSNNIYIPVIHATLMTTDNKGLGRKISYMNELDKKGLGDRKSYINGTGKVVPARRRRGTANKFVVIIFISMLLISSLIAIIQHPVKGSNNFILGETVPYEKSYNPNLINNAKFLGYADGNQRIGMVIDFKWRNESQLNEFLGEVNNPKSPNYRHFLTWGEFKKNFAPPKNMYNATVQWLEEKGVHIEHTWALRNAISIVDTVHNIEKAFNTKIGIFEGDGIHKRKQFYATLKPLKLPGNIIPYLNGISGTNNAPKYHLDYYNSSKYHDVFEPGLWRRYSTGADFEKAYRVYELYNDTPDGSASSKHIFATGLRAATVLWEGGSLFSEYAPYDPVYVNDYIKDTIPAWIQNLGVISHIWGYGTESDCASPGSNTDGGNNAVSPENELDLEMVATLAPGVDVVCVYSDSSQTNFPADNYNYILNNLTHNSTLTAVSNSWGDGDNAADATMMADVQALNALGVTVMASSGDSPSTTPSEPSTAAYDTYGVLAIGGTTYVPNGTNDPVSNIPDQFGGMGYNTNTTDPRYDELVWYDKANNGGTQCGVSSVYAEPTWQNSTIGAGRGGRETADISAVANRTLVNLSNGGSPGWYLIAGTSVSSPVMAGIFTEMAAYAGRYYDGLGNSTNDTTIYGFGFFAPTLYQLGYDYYNNSLYSSSPPFWDVTRTWEDYPAPPKTGWDNSTGWGVPDAWNIIHDIGFNMSSKQSKQTVNAGQSTYYNIDIWFPYNWTSEVGHFEVSGLPSGASFSTNVSYVHPAGSGTKSYVNFTITTSTSTPAGTYTLYITAYTYNHTSGHWGNLTYTTQVTLVVNSSVPEFSDILLIPLLMLITGIIGAWERRRFHK